MKIGRMPIGIVEVERGIKVTLYPREAIAQSREEAEAMAEIREAGGIKELDDEGQKVTVSRIFAVGKSPFAAFEGRFLLPLEPQGGHERVSILSRQAFEIVLRRNHGKGSVRRLSLRPINASPAINTGGYACIGVEMKGHLGTALISKDRQRVLWVSSRRLEVHASILHVLLDRKSMGEVIASEEKSNARFSKQWDFLLNKAEILAVSVKTIKQGFRALVRFRAYLEDFEGDLGNPDPANERSNGEKNGAPAEAAKNREEERGQ